jgi:hypothetical protein
MGGLQVQHPGEHAGSLQLNLIQRIYHDTRNNQRQSILPSLLGELLQGVNRPTLEDHVQQLGPVQWAATGKRQSFVFMAKFLRQYETKPDIWHAAALHGHSLGKTFFITEPERQVLREMQLFSVSQIFETNDNMTTSEEEKIKLFEHLDQHHPSLRNKLKWIHRNLRDNWLTQTPAYLTSFTTGQAQIQQDSKLSIKYHKQTRQDFDTSIGTTPAYATRQRDGVFYPSPKTFTDAYKSHINWFNAQ